MSTIIETNCETGETIEREMTDDELTAHQQLLDLAASEEARQTATITARNTAITKLTALGLTETEITAMLGGKTT